MSSILCFTAGRETRYRISNWYELVQRVDPCLRTNEFLNKYRESRQELHVCVLITCGWHSTLPASCRNISSECTPSETLEDY